MYKPGSWLAAQARHQCVLARFLLLLAPLLDSQRQVAWTSRAMLAIGAELEMIPVPPIPPQEPDGYLQTHTRVSNNTSTVWLIRSLPAGHPWAIVLVLTHLLLSTGVVRGGWKSHLQVSSLAKTMRPPTRHDASARCQLCAIHKRSAVFSSSAIITSFIMEHVSQQLSSLQNHHGIMGGTDAFLLCYSGIGNSG